MASGPHIRILPTHVANKIAAGEVVERPASILKELMENAVDAGARQIDIEITAGGRKLVAVRDDGSGMNRDDALLSIERQATSKIRDVDDIEKIATLGFRGEALAAVASVSRFRLVTFDGESEAGTELLVSGGKLQDVRETGCPRGTAVEVRDLFFNVPARRKFMRSQQTELGHIRAGFLVQALGRPEIGMTFTVDGRCSYELPGDAGLEARIRALFGADYLLRLKAVEHRHGDVFVGGYTGLPEIGRSDRNEQYVFINGRATSAPLINYAVREGYHSLLPKDRHPVLFLFVELAPDLVDVNVHPTKREVRFRHPGEVRDAVINAIRTALQLPLAAAGGEWRGAPVQAFEPSTTPRPAAPDRSLQIEDLPAVRAFQYPNPARPPGGGGALGPFGFTGTPGEGEGAASRAPEPAAVPAARGSAPWAWCRVVGQIGGLYVVLETEDGFVLMDPHAAHERVLFERFMRDLDEGRVPVQNLLMAETVELQPRDAVRVRAQLPLLKQMGFGISEFGGDAFVVDAVPSAFANASARVFLVEMAARLEESGSRAAGGRWREEVIAESACKASVKAHDRLALEEIERLVVDLAQTEMPYTCPHGRATLIFTSFKDLDRKFGRS